MDEMDFLRFIAPGFRAAQPLAAGDDLAGMGGNDTIHHCLCLASSGHLTGCEFPRLDTNAYSIQQSSIRLVHTSDCTNSPNNDL